jgi:hypothetical protein
MQAHGWRQANRGGKSRRCPDTCTCGTIPATLQGLRRSERLATETPANLHVSSRVPGAESFGCPLPWMNTRLGINVTEQVSLLRKPSVFIVAGGALNVVRLSSRRMPHGRAKKPGQRRDGVNLGVVVFIKDTLGVIRCCVPRLYTGLNRICRYQGTIFLIRDELRLSASMAGFARATAPEASLLATLAPYCVFPIVHSATPHHSATNHVESRCTTPQQITSSQQHPTEPNRTQPHSIAQCLKPSDHWQRGSAR